MNKVDLIKKLRETASVLEPLTRQITLGSKVWNGSQYRKVENPEDVREPHPFALARWLQLNTIADILEIDNTSLTERHREYLNRLLFGGMGSLADSTFGGSPDDIANVVNKDLKAKLHELFTILHSD